jgi:hypothetical protein
MALDIGWTVQSTGAVFSALEAASGRGNLAISALDEACCLGCKSKSLSTKDSRNCSINAR